MIQPPWIEITTTLPCPVGCYYCPQAVLQRAYQGERVLTLDRFEAVLRNVPTTVIVDFAGLSEPFGNPQCVDMVLLAHRLGYRLAMNTTLIGATDEDLGRLAEIPWEFFFYHDVRLERREIPFPIDGAGRIEKPGSRAGNLYVEERKEYDGQCARGIDRTANVMLPNGDVVLCCQDYGLKHPIGNLLTDHWDELNRDGDFDLCCYCEYWEPRTT